MNDRPQRSLPPGDHRLERDAARMRADGYAAVDLLVDHLATLADRPVGKIADVHELTSLFSGAPPRHGRPFAEVLEQVDRDVFANSLLCNHPRYFAFVPGPSNFYGVLADALAAGFNVFTGTWLESSGPAALELAMIDWLCRTAGLPDDAGGLFVSGGSVANLTGLAVARHVKLDDRTDNAVIYCSDQVHASVDKALFLLGFRREQLRRLTCDDHFRLDPGTLRDAVADDRQAGKRPFCVVGNAGTTNTGAIDPLNDLADLCEQEGMWFHIDGAYGASAVLGKLGHDMLAGLGRADSLVLDPHKWLFQPFEIGAVLVRDKSHLSETFHVSADYMQDTEADGLETNFCDYGIQLSRGFRALKLWMSLECFGLDAMTQAIDHGIELADVAEAEIASDPRLELTSPACLGIITFRYRGNLAIDGETCDSINRQISRDVMTSGDAVVTSTVLRGRTVLRLCTINPRTTHDDIRNTIALLAEIGDGLVGSTTALQATST